MLVSAVAVASTLISLHVASAAVGAPVVSVASSRCLDVTGNASTNGTQVQIWDCNGQQNQGWVFTAAGELRTFNERKCLDVPGGAGTAGTILAIWDCNGGANQRFARSSDGSIRSTPSGLCLDVTSNATANGTRVELWACNGQANQRWTGGSGSTGTASPPPSGCSAVPVDPAATRQARNLLCYLYSQSGNHILSGQQESTWVAGPDYEMNYLYANTGRYPAVRGLDMGDSPTFGARALAWWNSGGIPMVGYHMGSPAQDSDGYAGSQMRGDINAALTPGTADHTRLTRRLDAVAAQLKVVQDGGGAVLWRPYHEAGGTWFWWSMEGGAQYVRLWQFTFNYLTRTKGIHNLVWLHPYNGAPNASFYPGKASVDVAGADTYAGDHSAQNGLYNATRAIAGGGIPIALHENGPIPDPAQLQSTGTRWVLFNTWHTTWLTNTSTNPTALLRTVYTSAYVVTRDEVPNLR
ncbi:glycosyl hydrolase [Dactylosporangium sp. NPDC050588]|uniref:glycosyl hydrolase n=1 Tax=Dactylosporangium sp. NPDC050588 TaxID=3157211 RepID=UPI0033DD4BA7